MTTSSKKAKTTKTTRRPTTVGRQSAKEPSASRKGRTSATSGSGNGERLKRAALAEIGERLADGKADHEVPTAKEVANTPRPTTRSGKARGAPARSEKEATASKRPSGLDLAWKALVAAKEPLNAKAIAERVLAAGWRTKGRTPHATLYAAIVREIAAKGRVARFRKAERGLFAAVPAGKGA